MDYSVNLRNQQQSVKKSWKSVFIPSTNDTTEKKKNIFLLPRRQFDADFMRDFKA